MDPSNPNNYFGQSSNDHFGNSSNNPYNTITPLTQYSNHPSFTQSFNHPFENSYNTITPFTQYSNHPSFTQSSNHPFENSYNTITHLTQYSNHPSFTQSSNHPFENSYNTITPFTQYSKHPSFTQSSNNSSENDEESEENLLQWQAVCTAAAYTCAYYYEKFIQKEPCHTSIRTVAILITEILEGNEARFYQDFRMNKDVFISLCRILVDRYGLVPTRRMSEYEEVGMFLMTVAHGTGNRLMQEMWNHSGETISRQFHSVLEAVCRMARDIITPNSDYNSGVGYHRPQHPRYYPHFKDAIGAIDGTHIKCRIPETERTPYFGRKGYVTQNILAVCDFNLCFTFAWAGWEGGAHDSRILSEANTRSELNFPHPTEDKFYLVDAGYPHKRGYMTPYKGARIRYHIQDFRRANGTARAPRNAKESFNHLHSSCRMVIERTFGMWKARFAILANMPMYKIDTQTDIVLATMAIHNYIRKSNTRDSAFQTAESETYIPETSTSRTSNRDEEVEREDNTDDLWIAKRDTIAAHITQLL